VSDIATENRHLREPLAMANTELTEMRTKTEKFDNMMSILQVRYFFPALFLFHNFFKILILILIRLSSQTVIPGHFIFKLFSFCWQKTHHRYHHQTRTFYSKLLAVARTICSPLVAGPQSL